MESHYMVFMEDGKVILRGIYPINQVVDLETPTVEKVYHHTILIQFLGIKYHYEFKRLGFYISAPGPISLGSSYKFGKAIRPYLGIGKTILFEEGSGPVGGIMFNVKRWMFDIGVFLLMESLDIDSTYPIVGVGYRF